MGMLANNKDDIDCLTDSTSFFYHLLGKWYFLYMLYVVVVSLICC
jgi:hypothetical protein